MSRVICLVGPSGVGKSSYMRRLQSHLGLKLPMILTTRAPRSDDDARYHYVSDLEFVSAVESGKLLEWDTFNNYRYGTLISNVDELLAAGGVIMDLTPKGCIQVKNTYSDIVQIALLPDDPGWLYKRLKERGTNEEIEIAMRTRILEEYIDEVKALNLPTVYCSYSPSTWEDTFEKIIKVVNLG